MQLGLALMTEAADFMAAGDAVDLVEAAVEHTKLPLHLILLKTQKIY